MKPLVILALVLVLVCLIALPVLAANPSAPAKGGAAIVRPRLTPTPICHQMCPDNDLRCVPCQSGGW
jgi:hypothetical protein